MLLKADAASKEEGKTEINLTQLSEEEPTYLSASIQEYSDVCLVDVVIIFYLSLCLLMSVS